MPGGATALVTDEGVEEGRDTEEEEGGGQGEEGQVYQVEMGGQLAREAARDVCGL